MKFSQAFEYGLASLITLPIALVMLFMIACWLIGFGLCQFGKWALDFEIELEQSE